MGVAAPVIVEEMADWTALGGGNSGIVGNRLHTYGFHLGADEVGSDDYSRWRDPQGADGPYVDWRYSCAGDFNHGGNEALRAMHRNVLARLMRGELPMICELIGQPWADQPVYYWARWSGVGTLQRYTGSGHDTWSHISWYRSMVDQRAYLWSTATQEETMPPSAPQITIAAVTETSAQLTWDTPAGSAPNGTIIRVADFPLKPTDAANIVDVAVEQWQNSFDVKGLQPGKQYWARIFARTDGWGPSGAATFTTPAPPSTVGNTAAVAGAVVDQLVSRRRELLGLPK